MKFSQIPQRGLAATAAATALVVVAAACGADTSSATLESPVARVDSFGKPTGQVAVEITGDQWVTPKLTPTPRHLPYTLVDDQGYELNTTDITECAGIAMMKTTAKVEAPRPLALATARSANAVINGRSYKLRAKGPDMSTIEHDPDLPSVGTPAFARPGVLAGVYAGRGMVLTAYALQRRRGC